MNKSTQDGQFLNRRSNAATGISKLHPTARLLGCIFVNGLEKSMRIMMCRSELGFINDLFKPLLSGLPGTSSVLFPQDLKFGHMKPGMKDILEMGDVPSLKPGSMFPLVQKHAMLLGPDLLASSLASRKAGCKALACHLMQIHDVLRV